MLKRKDFTVNSISNSPKVSAKLPFTTLEGLKVTFIFAPTFRPLQIQVYSLTQGIRVELQDFQLMCEDNVRKKIRIGWVQTCEPNRKVQIQLPNGKSCTWITSSLPFLDQASENLEAPWYTEPWYPSPETFQEVYNSLAPQLEVDKEEKKKRSASQLKLKMAQGGKQPKTFSDDPNFPWYNNEQKLFVKEAGYSLENLADGETQGITIITSEEDRFTAWLVVQDIQTQACQNLGAFSWTARWGADVSKDSATPGKVVMEQELWHTEPSLAPKDLKTKVI